MQRKKLDVLFILGSHRMDGNSSRIKYLVEAKPYNELIEANYIMLKDKRLEICQSCYKCTKYGGCTISDDVGKIVEQMKISDIIIFVPVAYAFGSNSLFQIFLERAGFGYLRPQNRPLKNKIAMVAVIGRRYSHESIATQIINNILLNEMIIVGSGFLPLLHGEDFPGHIETDSEGIEAFHKNLQHAIEYCLEQKGGAIYENIID